MVLQRKKVAFLGDSITEGVGASDKAHRYTDVFQAITGCEIFVDGISGSRMALQHNEDMEIPHNKYFSSRVPALPSELDYIVVFGGTNDFGHGNAPFGTLTDQTVDTFCGALRVLCEALLKKYPYATIVFMTPLHRLSENTLVNEIGLPRKPLIDYVNAIRTICEEYALPVLDLYKISGMQPSVDVIREIYMPDGLHPSNAGAEKIANLLKQFILSL